MSGTRITAESIRQEMARLQEQMELLEQFKHRGYNSVVCPVENDMDTHQWVIVSDERYQGREGDYNLPSDYWFKMQFVCDKCGVELENYYVDALYQFVTKEKLEPTIHDPFEAMRETGGEEE